MLVFSRRYNEKIRIGDHIVVTVVGFHGGKVRLGIDAPPEVAIHREEVWQRIQQENQEDSEQ